METKEINILDFLYILYRTKRYIIWNFIIVCFIAAIASLIMTKYYKSTAILLPPSETQDAFGFSDALSALPVNIRLGSQGSPSDIFIGIMKSQTMAISIIERFNLVEEYKVPDRDWAVGKLKSLTSIKLTKEGLIEVSVEDRDRMRAAAIANMYWTVLDSLNQTISQRSARERADFLEQQIHENDNALKQAELDLKEYQLKTKALSPYQQQQVAISVTAELEMDILNNETLLQEYRHKSFSDTHPLVKELLNTIKIREEQLHNMRFGSPKDSRESLFVPLQEVPDMTLQYAKLMRRVEILGQLEGLLRQQFEESRIEQVNSTSTVNVLDRARPAIRKSRPKRALIVIVAGCASIFFSIVSIVIIDFFNRLTDISVENRKKVEKLARLLRIDT